MTPRVHMKPMPREIPAPGLGDVVAAGTAAVGVKPCGSCLRRKEALNRATPGWLSRLITVAVQSRSWLWKRRDIPRT